MRKQTNQLTKQQKTELKSELKTKLDNLISYSDRANSQILLTVTELQKVEPKFKLPELPPKEEYCTNLKQYIRKKQLKRRKLRILKDKFIEWRYLTQITLIRMELRNGFHTEFLVKEKKKITLGFVFNHGRYVFDPELKYYNVDAKLYCYDYHEDLSLPIKRAVPVSEIKTTLEEGGVTDIPYMINPSNLKRFEKAKLIEQILAAGDLANWLKQMKIIAIVILLIVIGNFLFNLYISGALGSVV